MSASSQFIIHTICIVFSRRVFDTDNNVLFAKVVHDSTESPFLNDLLDKKAFDAAVAKDAAAVARTVLIELFACVEPHPELIVAWVLF